MAEVTYVTIPQMTAATDSQVTDNGLLEMAVVDANAASGYSPKKVTRGQLLKDLKEDLLEIYVSGTSLIINGGITDGNEVEY